MRMLEILLPWASQRGLSLCEVVGLSPVALVNIEVDPDSVVEYLNPQWKLVVRLCTQFESLARVVFRNLEVEPNIEAVRQLLGWNDRQLAAVLSVSKSSVYQYRKGNRPSYVLWSVYVLLMFCLEGAKQVVPFIIGQQASPPSRTQALLLETYAQH